MSIFESVILGIIQGLTEFLPISSSAHLTVTSNFLKVEENIPFFVFLHLATLISALIYFRKEIFKILMALNEVFSGKSFLSLYKENENFKLFSLLIIGCFPTGIIGYFFEDFIKKTFSSLLFIGFFLIITGIFLYLTDLLKTGYKSLKEIGLKEAILIGIAQGIAILPGISRSGATVGTALFAKMQRELAVRFSFLISIPAILGAMIFEIKNTNFSLLKNTLFSLNGLLGFIFAFLSGYLAIYIFVKLIISQKLRFFAFYCFLLGLILVILNF